MLQICVLAIAGLFAALVVKKDKPEYASLIIMIVGFFIAIRVMLVIGGVVEELQNFEKFISQNVTYLKLLLKLVGITYVCDFAASLSKDAGHSALANHIELFGKIAIMVAGLPVIKMMIEMLEEIMR
ncbi:MAG: stage III sporulation protein AD [Lachnospiraceae bacterium]|nr:stage III sporulation protein AD [Lachnospiraceae bacterium]